MSARQGPHEANEAGAAGAQAHGVARVIRLAALLLAALLALTLALAPRAEAYRLLGKSRQHREQPARSGAPTSTARA